MATCERLPVQLSLQAHFPSLALGFAQWSRKALQAFSRLVCQNLTPSEATQWAHNAFVCYSPHARSQHAGLVWCVLRSGESEEKAGRMREEKKRLPSLPFPTENGGNPLWAVLNFFVEILS